MKTYSPKPEHVERRWFVIDASGQILGRVATEAAALLRGKHKPIFAPHMDTGDNVIIVNAGQVRLTGGKETKKFAYRHSGYPGGITATPYGRLMAERPAFVVEKAVRGMLPKNSLGRSMLKKLHVVEGAEHPHSAQKPVAYELGKPPVWEGIPAPKTRATKAPEPKAPAKKPTIARKPTAKRTAAKPASRKPSAKATAAKKATPARGAAKASEEPEESKASEEKPRSTKAGSAKSTAKETAAKPRRTIRRKKESS
jgi:large subunit ribosomal protein L13